MNFSPASCVSLSKRLWLLLATALLPVVTASAQTLHVVDAGSKGTWFDPGVRGVALADPYINTAQYSIGIPKALDVARGSSVRGPSPGLAAEIYDWRNRRNGESRPPTLEFLRDARDYHAELVFNVNMRGLVETDPDPNFNYRYYDTSIGTLANMASDWVRYTNHIVPTYRQGDTVNDPRSSAVLNSISWSSPQPGDSFDKLLSANEAVTPRVKYWEIGNEPRVGVVNSYSVSNGYTFIAPPSPPTAVRKNDYRERYAAITSAMRAEDGTIKVGPALVNGQSTSERPLLDSILNVQPDGSRLPVDFISYHPYERMGDLTSAADIENHLNSIYNRQRSSRDYLRGAVTASGRDPNAVELMASEHNVSYWSYNDSVREAEMAHALGTVETVFSYARLGLKAAHYWIWPSDPYDGTEFPLYKAFEGLRDYMGDTLLASTAATNLRTYTTRDSVTGDIAVWILNFDNEDDATVDLQFENLVSVQQVAQRTLGALSGDTTLFSSNLASWMSGGPTTNVDWRTSNLTGIDLGNFQVHAPAATITVLTLHGVVAAPSGDLNGDHRVDAADYVAWRKNVGGVYSSDDYAAWRASFGQTLSGSLGSAAAATIPEPATAAMLCTGLIGVSLTRQCGASGLHHFVRPHRRNRPPAPRRVIASTRPSTAKQY